MKVCWIVLAILLCTHLVLGDGNCGDGGKLARIVTCMLMHVDGYI